VRWDRRGGVWWMDMVRWQFTLNYLPLPGFVTWTKLRKLSKVELSYSGL
jgi:hypothetical protein